MRERNDERDTIDLTQYIQALIRSAAAILLAGVLLAGLAFFYARTFVQPKYQANVLFYVNNSSISIGATSVNISTGELSAASALVDTYVAILQSRANMETVIEKSGLNYTYEQLRKMVSARAVNSTGLFQITVTSTSPENARMLANTIAEVLPEKISDVVNNSSVKVVDYAVTPRTRSSPNYTSYAMRGLLAGIVIAAAAVLLISYFDNVIRSEEYLLSTYEAPILASIPNLSEHGGRSYGYGYGYEYGYGYGKNAAQKQKKGGAA